MKYKYRMAPNPTEFSRFTGLGTEPLDAKTLAKDVPCQEACPAKTNVPEYIHQISLGNHDAAYRINQEDNVFPSVLGRVCTRPCEDMCRHNWTGVDGPVQICHLKRSAADRITSPPSPLPNWFEKTGKNTAVIGGGPAGLTAARELIRYGHSVTLYERENHLGGMMVDGIPRFRLPQDDVEKEIAAIIEGGVSLKLSSTVDSKELEALIDTHDAVILATGTMLAKKLKLEGLNDSLAVSGLDFMNRYNNGKITSMEGDVVVIGGGFTAVDCARSCARAAKRLVGANNKVSILYRRSEHYMAADRAELEEIESEQIEVRTLSTPIEVKTNNGKLTGVVFQRNMLGKNNESGKPQIIPVEESEFEVPCNHLILAIGQDSDYSILPSSIKVSEESQTTSHPKVFVAGDFLTGSVDVIHAVAEGKAVADVVDQALTGQQRKKYHVSIELVESDGETGRFRDHDLQNPNAMPIISVPERAVDNAEVETGLDDDATASAATRCYLCSYKFEIDQDKCIHCDWCIDAAPRDCINRISRVFNDKDGAPATVVDAGLAHEATYIHIDSNECIRCGKCLRVCPTGAIHMRKMTRTPCQPGPGENKWVPFAQKGSV